VEVNDRFSLTEGKAGSNFEDQHEIFVPLELVAKISYNVKEPGFVPGVETWVWNRLLSNRASFYNNVLICN